MATPHSNPDLRSTGPRKAPPQKPRYQGATGPLLMRLWREFMFPYWPRLMMALGAMVVLALTYSLMPFVIEAIGGAIVPDSGVDGKPPRFRFTLHQMIIVAPLILGVVGIAYGLSQYAQSRLSLGVALDILRDMQNRMFASFLKSDLKDQRVELSGVIASRFTNDIQIMRETLTRCTNGVRDLMMLIGICASMIFMDIVLFAIVIGVYAILGWPIAWLGKKLRQAAKAAQEQTGDVAAAITQSASGAAMIKTYNLEVHEQSRLSALFDARTKLLKKAAFTRAINEPFIFFVGTIAIGFVVHAVGLRIRAGALDGPQLLAFIVALALLSQPARGLSTLYAVIQEGLAAFERILSVIDRQPSITDQALRMDQNGVVNQQEGKVFPEKVVKIDLDHVSFAYDIQAGHDQEDEALGDRLVLNDVSLSITHGERVALVGASGAGKTTLLHLISRLYDVTNGSIRINDGDIRNLSLRSLRENVAIVSQDALLFNDTIATNIGYGKSGASLEQIEAAAKSANAHQFISELEKGYATMAGERGETLSGGQRQRVAIARAFLKDAPILLLDEPTSALDARSEASIQIALDQLQKGRTTIIVAHRLSTIRTADKIVVMDKGKIVEMGNHEELLKRGQHYAKLIQLQFGD